MIHIQTKYTYAFSIEAVLAKTASKIDQNLKSGQLVILKMDTFSGPEVVHFYQMHFMTIFLH